VEDLSNQNSVAVAFADAFIKRFDSNHDGVVTRSEVNRIVRDYGFWEIDGDRDGRVTREELIKARSRRGR
jgi:Ca2+-binding EF-hand superfamily protein